MITSVTVCSAGPPSTRERASEPGKGDYPRFPRGRTLPGFVLPNRMRPDLRASGSGRTCRAFCQNSGWSTEADPRAAAVLLDELDPCALQGEPHCGVVRRSH